MKKGTIGIILIAALTVTSACSSRGVLEGKDSKVISHLKDQTVEDKSKKKVTPSILEKTVMIDLYVINKEGYVVSKPLALPKTENMAMAKQALEYLVVDGPVSNIIPNGYRATLPPNTEIKGVNIVDGTAIVDFSSEMEHYDRTDEEKIVQSVTWTLTQFPSIHKVKFKVNGKTLDTMPVGGMRLHTNGESRLVGINLESSDWADITQTKPITIYYLQPTSSGFDFVPVTKRIPNSEKNDVEAVIKELKKGPSKESSLISVLLPSVKLIDSPEIADGVAHLNFNDALL
jgi:germination protein M